MRNAIVACASCTLLGLAAGWAMRGAPKTIVHYVLRPAPAVPPQVVAKVAFPDYPKPPLGAPSPIVESKGAPSPATLTGKLSSLPSTMGTLPPATGSNTPLVPNVASKLPVADLNADEALAKRIVLGLRGEVVSTSDAKDSTGKVGRTLVAETGPEAVDVLRQALREALHDRIVLSDAGTVGGGNPELLKAQEDLVSAEKARDKARIDFLPQAPVLRQIEDDYARLQQRVAEIRKRTARRRTNVMIRPGLTMP